jgi:hypothetical protein
MSRPLVAGYPWSIRLTATTTPTTDVPTPPALFPAGCALRAEVRDVEGGAVLATLTTAAGTITRESDTTVLVTIAGPVSQSWAMDRVRFDLARTDTTPDTYLGFKVVVPVVQPITQSIEAPA